jgi:3-dehydroquinate synthase
VGGAAPYDVVVGHDADTGVLDQVGTMLGDAVERVAVCYPESLPQLAARVVDRLGERAVLRLELPDGEAAQTGAVAQHCWDRLGEAGFTRSDAVVTVGGGATTDLGGFVAATWLRGVPVVHVPTTLLAMVDAAVGGKTGMNTPAGKNLVGAFHEPAGVVCDLDVLASLPAPELVAGLGEVVKCGFIADPEILALVERCPATSWSAGWPRWSSAASSPTRPSSPSWSATRRRPPTSPPRSTAACCASWWSARCGSRLGWWPATCAKAAAAAATRAGRR